MKGTGRTAAPIAIGGFTLVEVMVALVVLVVGALAVSQLSISAAVILRRAAVRTELIASAANRLEYVRTRPFAQMSPVVEVDTVTLRGRMYARRLTITAPSGRTRRIEIDLVATGDRSLRHSLETWVSAP